MRYDWRNSWIDCLQTIISMWEKVEDSIKMCLFTCKKNVRSYEIQNSVLAYWVNVVPLQVVIRWVDFEGSYQDHNESLQVTPLLPGLKAGINWLTWWGTFRGSYGIECMICRMYTWEMGTDAMLYFQSCRVLFQLMRMLSHNLYECR